MKYKYILESVKHFCIKRRSRELGNQRGKKTTPKLKEISQTALNALILKRCCKPS